MCVELLIVISVRQYNKSAYAMISFDWISTFSLILFNYRSSVIFLMLTSNRNKNNMKSEHSCLNFLNQCSYPVHVKVENKKKCSNASREVI